MNSSVIVSAVRTPVAGFMGSLVSFNATDLGAVVIKEVLNRAKIKPSDLDQVIMGCVLTSGLGQAPARQASIKAGVPDIISAITINKVCSSGLQAVIFADLLIRAKEGEVIAAGGMESMSNAPYALSKARLGYRLGNGEIIDLMVHDGLWDFHTNQHMGSCAELCAKKFGITRSDQDEFAIESYKRAQAAIEGKGFKAEIVPVSISQKKGEPLLFDTDEEPGRAKFDKIPKLPPSFVKDGTVTAANASSISDGAAALIVMSEERAKKEGHKPMVRIVAHDSHSHAPEWFTTAPIEAIKKLLKKTGWKTSDVDLFEINEAFSAVTLAAIKELKLDPDKVNIKGGAVALGHPIGASGARILTTLIYSMKEKNVKRGIAALCNGGGEATAIAVEAI